MISKCLIYSVFLGILISGCATSNPLRNGKDTLGNPVCLTDCSDIPAAIDKYRAVYDLDYGEGRTDYLLTRVRVARGKFVRNGESFTSTEAIEYLRWKIEHHGKTYGESLIIDRAYVNDVLKGSKSTGQPYEIVFEDGTRHNAKNIVLNELDALDAHLKA